MANDKSKHDIINASDIEWTAENEIKLFYAMRGHKPVGVAKNFHMIGILDEFSKLTEREVSSKAIWSRLEKLYDMETLNENEELPFPQNTIPFTIEGIKEFDELIAKKFGNDSIKTEKEVNKEDTEVTTTGSSISNTPKTGNKSKTQETNKSSSKAKIETEKNCKSDRKEDTKQSDKSEEIEDKSMRSAKKAVAKPTPELRSSTHSVPSSAKKRK